MQNPIIEKIKVLYQNADSKILIEDCFNKIFTPLLHTKEIGVTSKQILDWKKAGLLLESDSNHEGWTEFNIRDGIWLKFISELRKFGMPYVDIKRVKNSFLHKVSSIQEKISTLRKNEPNNDAVGIVDDFMKKNLSSIDLEENQTVNEFDILIVILLLFKSEVNISFYFDEDHFAFVPSYEPITNTQKESISELNKLMYKKSFALINIKSLVSVFFENEKLDHVDDLFLGLMNKFEKDILEKVRSGDYQQVIVKIDNGEVIQLRLKKKKDDATENKISRLFKKGDYKEIQLITRDGKVISYDETEIIKMNI
jgi:DNA-binding transcriptional MerR regulator